MRLRLIPATITAALLLMAVKTADIVRGSGALSEALLVSKVEAQQEPPPEAKAEEKKEEPKAEAASDGEEKPESEEKPSEDAKPKEEGHGEKKEEHGDGHGEKKEPENPAVSQNPPETGGRHFSAVELELLQNLSRRRDELDRWERNIQIKEAALNATEKRINDKIGQIEAMKKEVAALLTEYNTQEDAKIKGLVKIYESMKPADAARIFDELDIPILLLVIDKMAEKKAAPILAGMDARKAKQITVELAAQHRLDTARLNRITAPPAAQQ